MKASDLNLLTSTSHPTVSPDGARIVFSAARPDIAGDTYVGQLWQVPADGSAAPERLTRGHRDTSPTFSPDGTLLAFLRSAPGAAPQLQVVRAAGGEPVAVTDQKLGVGEYAWSPDGSRFVFVARAPEQGRYGTVEGLSASAEPGRTITTTRYLSNGEGFIVDKRSHVFVVDVPDVSAEPFVTAAPWPSGEKNAEETRIPEPHQITSADADHAQARFTPDGSAVTFVASLHDTADDDLRSCAYAIPVAADGTPGDLEILAGPEHNLGVEDVLVTPSGVTFLLAADAGPEGVDFVGTNNALYVQPTRGAAPERITEPENLDLGGHLTLAGDDAVLVVATVRGTTPLLRVSVDGATEHLTEGALEVTGYARSGGTTAVTFVDATTSGEVGVLRDGGLVSLSDFSAALRDSGLIEPVETVIESRDGTPIHGWVLTPAGSGPHPVLLVIHGGPYAQFTGSVFDEAQVYAGAGYAVVMCNPRGAAGYGQAFGRAIKERMGTVDMTDVLDFFDGAIAANTSFDGTRTGIMGGSYGGYLTAWTVAHEHRFAGAIVERGFLDPEFFVGTSDIGTFFSEQYAGSDVAHMATQSPQAVVSQVTTPTLVIHSEDDLRCPLPQAERYHLGLVRAGVDTKMLIFPGENHELTRSGRPRHRVQRFDAILDWWNEYLPV